MGDHFKAFAIETMFFDEEVGDRGLAIVGNNLFSPDTRTSIESRRDEGCGFSRPVWRATQASVDDFLGVGPRLLVRDVLDTHIGGLVLDRDQRLGWSGRGRRGRHRSGSDDVEDAGIMEPAMDDMTDASLEGCNEGEDPCWAMREEPRWVKM